MDDFIDTARRDSKASAKLILTYVHRFEEFLKQNLARMNWGYLLYLHFVTSMIINNLNIVCIPIFPFEADSPLIVNANAMLAFSIT